ncbi:hypothetical protein TUZN_1469 [Thermoproteus uzoniensis 768-20]|uniref:Uncharacterized protein n=1 Tax=Thermoproteus uzoniensis (strain 768-20) TaxID=999630 RepID=F2L1T4_THEU7|nr:hypothetical protein TUZN_1469 [Thermoproteus uzoniensis 768-20]
MSSVEPRHHGVVGGCCGEAPAAEHGRSRISVGLLADACTPLLTQASISVAAALSLIT